MNYYDHHIGDYAAATEHLTWAEDMAYTRLIRVYYRTEKPIPRDIPTICRLIRAVARQEKQAVESVLREFFTLEDDGWHQKRCDEELARMHAKSGKARDSAAKRWHNDRNANAYANASPDAMRTHTEGNAPNSQEPVTNTQEPSANSQQPGPNTQEPREKKARSVAAIPRPAWLPPEWEEFEKHRREKRVGYTPTAREGAIRKLQAWRDEGRDLVGILRHSIDNGYTGLFEPRGRPNGDGNQTVAAQWARAPIDGESERVSDE